MSEDQYQVSSDQSRQDATSPDMSQPVATSDDYISIKEAQHIFISKGRQITQRTLQRYCENQKLDGQKMFTSEGEKWFVRKSSIFICLEELNNFYKLRASRQVATSADMSTSVAELKQSNFANDNARQQNLENVSAPVERTEQSHTTTSDMSRPDAAGRDMSEHSETVEPNFILESIARERGMYEQILESYKDRIEDLTTDKKSLQIDKEILVEQLRSKDKQIDQFFASERDTKSLTGRLQSLMNALWPSAQKQQGERYVQANEALESGIEESRERQL
jgi:hypothetical protein